MKSNNINLVEPKYLFILKKSKSIRRWLMNHPWLSPMIIFNYSAIRIQAMIRGYLCRHKHILYGKSQSILSHYNMTYYDTFFCYMAVIVIQTTIRNRLLKHHINKDISLDKYVNKIQNIWRRYCFKKIYKYLRNFIINKLRSPPMDLLKTIIPDEATCLDIASGNFARFRLGGVCFPPKILFKLFTTRPLCDVNSFAPRNYFLEKQNQLKLSDSSVSPMKMKQLKVGRKYFDAIVTTSVSFKDWYHRIENNSWRPINIQAYEEILNTNFNDQLKKEKHKLHHYSRFKRQFNSIKYKRQRKREWIMKACNFAMQTNEFDNVGQLMNTDINQFSCSDPPTLNDILEFNDDKMNKLVAWRLDVYYLIFNSYLTLLIIAQI